ncbi:hypothetical protein ACFX1R_000746 [Malus domestica]
MIETKNQALFTGHLVEPELANNYFEWAGLVSWCMQLMQAVKKARTSFSPPDPLSSALLPAHISKYVIFGQKSGSIAAEPPTTPPPLFSRTSEVQSSPSLESGPATLGSALKD